jgi:hypothetical protein
MNVEPIIIAHTQDWDYKTALYHCLLLHYTINVKTIRWLICNDYATIGQCRRMLIDARIDAFSSFIALPVFVNFLT